MDNFKVYVHTTPDGKRYVGVTSIEPEKRWLNGKGYPQKVFGSAIEEFGWENILHEIVAENLSEQEASEMEMFLIKKYNTTDENCGYNVRTWGYKKAKREPKNKTIKTCISFTKEFYKRVKKCAEARNVTVASYIKEAIAQRMDNERG